MGGGAEDENVQKFKMDVKKWLAKQVFSANIWQIWVAVLDFRTVFGRVPTQIYFLQDATNNTRILG